MDAQAFGESDGSLTDRQVGGAFVGNDGGGDSSVLEVDDGGEVTEMGIAKSIRVQDDVRNRRSVDVAVGVARIGIAGVV